VVCSVLPGASALRTCRAVPDTVWVEYEERGSRCIVGVCAVIGGRDVPYVKKSESGLADCRTVFSRAGYVGFRWPEGWLLLAAVRLCVVESATVQSLMSHW